MLNKASLDVDECVFKIPFEEDDLQDFEYYKEPTNLLFQNLKYAISQFWYMQRKLEESNVDKCDEADIEELEKYSDIIRMYLEPKGIEADISETGWMFNHNNKYITLEEVIRIVYAGKLRPVKDEERKTSTPTAPQSQSKPSTTTPAQQASTPPPKAPREPNLSIEKTFAEYVRQMSRDEFFKTLNSEYVYIQGNCISHKPMLDIRASIEFSLAILLEKYISDRLPAETKRYAPLIINLADLLGCAFMGMPDFEWCQMLNNLLKNYSDFLPYTEWFDIFRLIESEYMEIIVSMPFSYGDSPETHMSEINANTEYYREVFVPKYNLMRSYADTLNYYKNAGLQLFDGITVTP